MSSAIQREIRQQVPFRSPEHECLVGLFRTADGLKRHLSQVLDASGITLQQYNVLRILRGASKDGLPTLEIAERMVEHAPGITRLVDRLEEKGLVRRRRWDRDRRQVHCWIAQRGLDLLSALEESVHRSNLECLLGLTPREIVTLTHLMDKIRKGLGSLAPRFSGTGKGRTRGRGTHTKKQ
jgi:DNA-binding MarR family transcriptional regulator